VFAFHLNRYSFKHKFCLNRTNSCIPNTSRDGSISTLDRDRGGACTHVIPVKIRLHFAVGCTTACTTGCSTGCKVSTPCQSAAHNLAFLHSIKALRSVCVLYYALSAGWVEISDSVCVALFLFFSERIACDIYCRHYAYSCMIGFSSGGATSCRDQSKIWKSPEVSDSSERD